ncbi:MAG: ArnT family glycosyltransferase [Rhodomicrobiaceae bacterium]
MRRPEKAALSLKQWSIILFTSLLFLLPGQVSIPVMDRDEARYAQASRQMIETRDFIDIRFQDQTRYVKPILTYWLQTASTQILAADTKQIWTYRLPSLIGALIAILVTAWLGARMGGGIVGMWAGLLLAASMIVTIEARTAKTDALLLAATVSVQAALYLIWSGIKDSKKAGSQKFLWAPFLFWVGTAIGVLIKGPIILLVSISTIISLSIWEKNWRWIRNLYPVSGLVLVSLIIAPWLILITLKTDGQFWVDSIGHAFLGKVAKSDDSHGMPPGYHLVVYFACFWPVSLLTVLQNAYAYEQRKQAFVKFLLCWLWPCFIIFELVVTKLPHYTLPLYPAIAILTSFGLVNAKQLLTHTLVARLHWLNATIFTLFTIVLMLVPAGLSYYFGQALNWLHFVGLIVGIFIILFALNWARDTTVKNMIPVLGATASFYLITFGALLPNNLALWPSYHLSQKIASFQECKHKPVAIVGYSEPSNVFYQGTKTVFSSASQAVTKLKRGSVCSLIVIEGKERKLFLKHLETQKLAKKQVDFLPGINVSKGKSISLYLYQISNDLN